MTTVDGVLVVLVIKIKVDRNDEKVPEKLNVNRYIVKKLTYDEAKKIPKEMKIENSSCKEDKEENEKMGKEKEKEKEIA